MATWSLTGNTGVLQSIPHVPLPTHKTAGPVFDKHEDSGDIAEKIRNAIQAKARATESSEPTLTVAAPAAPTTGPIVFPGASPGADRLSEARRLIAIEQYEQALALIERFLENEPQHQTAIYLKGYCELHLGEAETALTTIVPLIRLRPQALDAELRRIRADIRDAMTPEVVEWVAERSAEGNLATAIARLEKLLALDEEVPIYLCMRIHLLLLSDRLDDAAEAAQRAARFCHGSDRPLLDALTNVIRRRRFDIAVEPARRQYRELNYRKARKALDQIKREWTDEPVFGVFSNYLQALGGGLLSRGRAPAEVVPQGPFALVDTLHFLLVREEVAIGKGLLTAGHPEPATRVLSKGLQLAPHFPYLNYLMGQAMFTALLEELPNASWRDHEAHRQLLAAARTYAAEGRKDAEIDGVDELIEAIDDVDRIIVELRDKFERQARDIDAVVGPLMRRFTSILESVGEGISSPEEFRQVQSELRALRKNLPAARKKAVAEHVKDALQQFEEMVEKNWQQLAEMEPQVQQVEQLFALRKRLTDALMSAAESRTGPNALQALRSTLVSLKSDVTKFRKEKLMDDVREGAKGLESDIDGYLGQLDEVDAQAGEVGRVNALVQRLNDLMESVSNRTYRGSMESARNELSSIFRDALQLKRELRSPQAKKNVDELLNAISGMLGR